MKEDTTGGENVRTINRGVKYGRLVKEGHEGQVVLHFQPHHGNIKKATAIQQKLHQSDGNVVP